VQPDEASGNKSIRCALAESWESSNAALAIDAKDQRLIARLRTDACEYVDQAGLLEAGQHQAADAGAGFVSCPLDQRKEVRLKRRLLALQKREMQLGKVVPQIRMFVSPWCKDEFGNRVRVIHSIDD
jgi:hypothetical protein